MKPYSEDLRVRIVRALQEGGMSKSGAARLFEVSLSSVKRYARLVEQGASLEPRKGGGRPPKVNQTMEKLLEEDVEQHPTATISERRRFLEQLTGKRLGDSTIRRVLKRLGFSQKTDNGGAGAGRVAKSCLEGDTNPRDRLLKEAGVRRRDGREHFALALARLVKTWRAGTLRGAP
jgi:transposase